MACSWQARQLSLVLYFCAVFCKINGHTRTRAHMILDRAHSLVAGAFQYCICTPSPFGLQIENNFILFVMVLGGSWCWKSMFFFNGPLSVPFEFHSYFPVFYIFFFSNIFYCVSLQMKPVIFTSLVIYTIIALDNVVVAQPRKLISSTIKASNSDIPVASAYSRRLEPNATVEPTADVQT